MTTNAMVPLEAVKPELHAAGRRLPLVDAAVGARQLALHLSVIEPGHAAHPPHQHAGEEIMYLLEGTGEFLCGEEWRPVGPGTALFCAEHVRHGLRNAGAVPIKYLVVRVVA